MTTDTRSAEKQVRCRTGRSGQILDEGGQFVSIASLE